jgi:hypothetical protein
MRSRGSGGEREERRWRNDAQTAEGAVSEGGISLSMNRDEGGVVRRSPEEHREPDLVFDPDYNLDDLATGLADGTITRGRAMKLAGAALVGSALSLFVTDDAEAARIGVARRRRLRRFRRRCRRREGARFCKDRVDGTNRARCCRQPTSNRRCRRGRCGGG